MGTLFHFQKNHSGWEVSLERNKSWGYSFEKKENPTSLWEISLEKDEENYLLNLLSQGWKLPWENGKFVLGPPVKNDYVIFAGSFNPWHLGHQACVDLCPLEVVLFPDSNPWKSTICSPWEQYKSLVKTPNSVYPGFLLKEKNYTSNWLPLFDTPQKILMGDDSFLDLPRWKNPKLILDNLSEIFVVNRTNLSLEKNMNWVNSLNPNIKVNLLGHHAFEHLSSSQFRKNK